MLSASLHLQPPPAVKPAGDTLGLGGGEMGERIRAYDWSGSPIGPVETWPQSLKATVRILLASRYPMLLCWGPHLVQIYNDGYSALIGDKHPEALGKDVRVTLAEAWDTLGPMIEEAMRTGRATWMDSLPIVIDRHGYREEAFFTVSHAPAEDDDGRIVGMLGICSEVTERVLSERRMRLLRDLAGRTAEAHDVAAACRAIVAGLDPAPPDLPFALVYLAEDDGRVLRLRARAGIEPRALWPERVEADADAPLPFAQALAQGPTGVDLEAPLVRGGPWGETVRRALVLPLDGDRRAPLGVLVAGLNPSRALDEGYRSFLALLAAQVAGVLRGAKAHEGKLQLAVDATDLGLWDYDLETGQLTWSDRLKALYGLPADAAVDFEAFREGVHPEDRERVLAAYAQALDPASGGRFSFEHRTLAPNGAVRWLLGAGQVVFDETGRPLRATGTARDITNRKRNEAAIRQSEERFRLATDAFEGGVFDYDPVNDRVERTARHYALVGEVPGAIGPSAAAWFDRIHPEDRPGFDRVRQPLYEGDAPQYEAEYRVRHADGRWIWIWHRALARRDEAGRLRRVVGTLVDITARRQAEEHQRLLLDELNHRVKNTLATVQSIAAQTLRSSPSPEAFSERFEGRLLALSRTHNLLTERHWQGASLRALIETELAPYGRADQPRFTLEGPETNLEARAAVTLGMTFHELATNAAKYGALSRPGGRIEVGWRLDRGEGNTQRLVLTWTERGGPPVAPPRHRGFGSRLIERGVGAELAGAVRIAYEPDGLSCHLDIPFSPGA